MLTEAGPRPESAPLPQQAAAAVGGLRDRLNGALRGKEDVVELVLACLLGGGNLLIEDLPGLGKTTLAKALAATIGGRFSRVQCTPDLLPGDVTGFSLFNQQTRQFELHRGPVFADVLLADEINRATPRTQSALLEAMAERQVSIDNETHPLPPTFFVIATQNPLEVHGTFPLPEAQLDRFSMKLSIGPPEHDALVDLLDSQLGRLDADHQPPAAVLTPNGLLGAQRACAAVGVQRTLLDYAARIAAAINDGDSHAHVSPRAMLQMLRCAQAWALLAGRDFVTPDDLRAIACPTLRVRFAGELAAADSEIEEHMATVDAPVFG